VSDKIKTISIANNQEKFEAEVNELLKQGYAIASCSCSAHSYDGNIDEMWQAILFKQDLSAQKHKWGGRD
jgi:ribulose bisphosphate carboxylase small subunit